MMTSSSATRAVAKMLIPRVFALATAICYCVNKFNHFYLYFLFNGNTAIVKISIFKIGRLLAELLSALVEENIWMF